jgi:diacylglycerol kinase (ATP)
MNNKSTGLIRLYRAIIYSIQGLQVAWCNETAFRQELSVAVAAIIAAFWLDIDAVSRLLLIASLILVMIVEIIDSAIEAVVDYISKDLHPLAKQAKDLGSAAVFLTVLLAVFTWVTLLWNHFF